MENLDENVKVLDIGCATGLFLDHMKGLGWDTYGVEVCSSAAEYGNRVRNLNIFTGTLAQADFPDNMFDVVHLSHVIEHINDPNSFLENIVRVLKPGGVLYCVTPNISGLQSHIFKERWRSVIPDHMILYSVKTLKQLLVKHGLIYKKHKTWGGMCAGSGYPESIKKFLDRTAKIVGFGDVVITKSIKPTN
ncbi:MAG: hypothetical protein B6229_02605 [Spirochaetaceae bacterium 4572_7]|nr:MAG: hypothetical protein B6229_02605 [Spirochaetaceae bacterium 4572_7]